MSKLQQAPSIYCFGEILWDVLPDGPKPGGAPLNVTYHLNKLGISAHLISRVGADTDGNNLKELMEEWNLNVEFLQTDPVQDTSQVLAHIDEQKDVSYEIVFPVAWDYIEINPSLLTAVKTAEYFVYGSLASRNEITKNTLNKLINFAHCKVLDINLRPPFYKKESLENLLSEADILKVNQTELEIINSLFNVDAHDEEEQVSHIKDRFSIKEVIITKGSKGASYYPPKGVFHSVGKIVEVKDTVGSGDSFLAAFITSHSRKEAPNIILKKATAMGAFIAGKEGGCPEYQIAEYIDFLSNSKIS